MRRACLAALILLAGCGGSPAADLFEVKRSGADANANLTLLVSDDGTVTCNGGKRTPIPNETAAARPRARARPVRAGRAAPGAAARPERRAQLPRADAGGNARLRRHLASAARRVRAAHRLHQRRDRARVWDRSRLRWTSSRRSRPIGSRGCCAHSLSSRRRPMRTASPRCCCRCYHRRPEAKAALIAAGAPVGTLEAAALGEVELLRGRRPERARRRRLHAAAPRRVLRRGGGGARAARGGRDPGRRRGQHLQGPPDPLGAPPVRDHASVRLLLEAGADPNVRQQGGYTPLHTAAHSEDLELIQLLLAHGADRDARRRRGQDPARHGLQRGAAGAAQPVKWTLPLDCARACARSTKSSRLIAARHRRATSFIRADSERRSSRPCLASSPNSTVAAIS